MDTNTRKGLGRILLVLGRLALAGSFLFAAYLKLKLQVAVPWSVASVKTSLSMFAMEVDSYRMLPPWAISIAAYTFPLPFAKISSATKNCAILGSEGPYTISINMTVLGDSDEDVDASARRVVDATQDSCERDFAARERGEPAFRSRP
jgi:hypothetical protein